MSSDENTEMTDDRGMADHALYARLDRCRQLLLPPERDAGEFPAQLRQRLAEGREHRRQPGAAVRLRAYLSYTLRCLRRTRRSLR